MSTQMSTKRSPRTRSGLLIVSASLFAVLVVLALNINADWVTGPDDAVERWLDAHRSARWRLDADGAFSYLGRPLHVATAGVVAGTLLAWKSRSVLPLALVTGGVGAGVVVEQTFKAVFGRSEATLMALHDGSLTAYQHSFPSGHVTGATTLLGMIAVCLGVGRSAAGKALLTVLVVAGVLTVTFLALYSRAHIFSDVVGGMVLGGALVSLGAAALGRYLPAPGGYPTPRLSQLTSPASPPSR